MAPGPQTIGFNMVSWPQVPKPYVLIWLAAAIAQTICFNMVWRRRSGQNQTKPNQTIDRGRTEPNPKPNRNVAIATHCQGIEAPIWAA